MRTRYVLCEFCGFLISFSSTSEFWVDLTGILTYALNYVDINVDNVNVDISPVWLIHVLCECIAQYDISSTLTYK